MLPSMSQVGSGVDDVLTSDYERAKRNGVVDQLIVAPMLDAGSVHVNVTALEV